MGTKKKVVLVRSLRLGEGAPKICVPLTGQSLEALLAEVEALRESPADLVEWRVDCFDKDPADSLEEILTALAALRSALGGLPLLFTFRSAAEGGRRPIAPEDYLRLNEAVAASGLVDLLDVELSAGEAPCRTLIAAAHEHKVPVVLSSHDFQKTPGKQEMLDTLRRMRALGADIPKLAVMPATPADVLALLSATETFTREADGPVITMSMGALGAISRVAGAFFGSALTFGAVGARSAPGQLAADELHTVLRILQKAL